MSDSTNILARLLNNTRKTLWMRRAQRLLAKKRHADAAMWCEMALELDRTFAPARELLNRVRDDALREPAPGETARTERPSAIEHELDAAFWAVEADRPQEAGEHLRRALRTFAQANGDARQPPELMLARGEVSYLNGWYGRAWEELRAAQQPGFAGYEATYYLGLCALALGKNADSQRYLGEIVGKHPSFATDRLYDLLEKCKPA
jgi:tetratricopeptide (TPR) repeat protein